MAISANVARLCMEPSKEPVYVGNMDALLKDEVKRIQADIIDRK
jgi:hypothetical protein